MNRRSLIGYAIAALAAAALPLAANAKGVTHADPLIEDFRKVLERYRFEFNDKITRAKVNLELHAVLKKNGYNSVEGKKISVWCDGWNNPQDSIDRGELHANVYDFGRDVMYRLKIDRTGSHVTFDHMRMRTLKTDSTYLYTSVSADELLE